VLKDPESTVTATLSPAQDERGRRGALIVSPGAPWSAPRAARIRPCDVSLSSPLSSENVEQADDALGDGAYVSLDAGLAGDPAAVNLIQSAWNGGHFVLPSEGLGPLPSALAVAGVDLSNVNVVDLRALARRRGSIEPEASCVAVAVPSADVARAIGAILKAIPSARGVVVLDPGTGRMHATPWQAPTMSAVASQRGREAIVVAGRGASGSDPDSTEVLPRPVAVLGAELVARGASTREVSAALQHATGMSRKAAYAAALELVPPDS
jgi:hypothetical protein